jgi:annexin A7/11
MATVTVPPYLNMQEDVNGLHRAFKGLGCDEKRVIQILAHRTQAQRLAIADAYYRQYGESIHKRLKSELHGNLERAMLLWMMDTAQRDAMLLYEAMQGIGTRDSALIGIICSRTPSQLYAIKQAYHTMYRRTLEHHIDGDTSGDYRKLLLALARGNRSESLGVDTRLALADAQALYRAGEARLGTNEDTFIHILTTRSAAHLNCTFQYYLQTYGHSFEKAVRRETSGLFEDALVAVVQCVCYPARFFAKELYTSMKGLGTNDEALIRVVTTRAEIDMYYIKQEFQATYKKSLESMIVGDTSGNYKFFLLSLVGGA